MRSKLVRRAAAEAVGTALLVAIGTGTIVRAGQVGGIPQWAMAVAWFLAVLVPLVAVIGVSGAHLNPAVTLALAASRRIAWAEVPGYWASQLAGAFAGSALVLVALGGGSHLGATVPAQGDVVRALLAEALFTGILVAAVFTLADWGEGPSRWRILLPPGAVGLSTYVIGPRTGSSLNPARTIAPAVLSGTYLDLWVYLVSVPLAALLVAMLWSPRAVDLADRGPGRLDASR